MLGGEGRVRVVVWGRSCTSCEVVSVGCETRSEAAVGAGCGVREPRIVRVGTGLCWEVGERGRGVLTREGQQSYEGKSEGHGGWGLW